MVEGVLNDGMPLMMHIPFVSLSFNEQFFVVDYDNCKTILMTLIRMGNLTEEVAGDPSKIEELDRSESELDLTDFHPRFRLLYTRLENAIRAEHRKILQSVTIRYEIFNYGMYDVALNRLRDVLLTMITVFYTEMSEYKESFDRHVSIIRYVFVKIWKMTIEEYDDKYISKQRLLGCNMVRVRSSTAESRTTQISYYSEQCKIKKVMIKYPCTTYLLNVYHNTCECPDYVFRRLREGTLCKHLKQLKNKTKCLLMIKEFMSNYFHNVPYPMKEMLAHVYQENVVY